MDERLRQLERRYEASGDAADEARFVRALLRGHGLPIQGDWRVEHSSARFRVEARDGAVSIEGRDSADGERFEVSDVHWDGRRLRATFRMPSTNHVTHSDLRLTSGGSLAGRCTGDFEGVEVWLREGAGASPDAGAEPTDRDLEN